jgi:hypothetical protein
MSKKTYNIVTAVLAAIFVAVAVYIVDGGHSNCQTITVHRH